MRLDYCAGSTVILFYLAGLIGGLPIIDPLAGVDIRFNYNSNLSDYRLVHEVWINESVNNYTLSLGNDNKLVAKRVLKIYWSLDESTIPDNIRIITVKEFRNAARLPPLPIFIEASHLLHRDDRLRILRDTLQEAFNYWSIILQDRIIFEYRANDYYLKSAPDFNQIIMVSMGDILHFDHHRNRYENFESITNLAHASSDLIHFNRQGAKFYIAPNVMSKRVYISVEPKDFNFMALQSVTTDDLAKRYNASSYHMLYQQTKAAIYPLAGVLNATRSFDQQYSCFICIAVHEIGHVLGFNHNNDSSSAMFRVNGANEVMFNDLDKLIVNHFYADFFKRINNKKKSKLTVCLDIATSLISLFF